ncbi:sulfotransferase 1C2-like protein, partial [Leptotrombidium deliense]
THLPFNLQPYNPKAKYIYVARNPKDVLVSFCHHVHLFPDYQFSGTVHDLLPYFLDGDIDFGSWSDHILSWWPHRHDDNVLFMLYEDMKSNIKDAILKIASFMGNEYRRKLDENPNILEKVINLSDISHMKQTTNKDFEKLWDGMGLLFENRDFNFVRKGIIGDWRNEICAEDNAIFEKWFEDTFKNSGIYNLWDKYDVFEHKQN